MLKTVKKFFGMQRGNLVENIIYIIVIGGLTFAFYTTNVQEPMTANMNSLNTQIGQWTTINP